MKKLLAVLLILSCGAALHAQTAEDKKKAADARKAAAAEAAKKPAAKGEAAVPAAAPAPQPKPAAKPAAKQSDDAEESMVMIDDKADPEGGEGRFSAGAFAADQEEQPTVPGGMPSSYGQCKGVITEGGRSILVFESPDDGAISLVQLVIGKAKVSWQLLSRIPRSAD